MISGSEVYSYRRLPMGTPFLPSSFPYSGDLARLTEWAERVVEEGVVGARHEPRFSQTTLLLRPVGKDVKRCCNIIYVVI